MFEPMAAAALAGNEVVQEDGINNYHYWTQVVPIKNEQGAVIAGMAVSQNITRQKQAEHRFRTMFEHSPDAIFILDSATTLIEDCNEVACRMNGYTREELIGQPIKILNT
ncbi:MAG TPA: PAS domain S-box protein, partial [Phototrophicaceae bacterium]|nr:PAS domain S-box protein [Phototrophicaceae bacterium]